MNVSLQFRDFEGTAHLRSFLWKEAAGTIEKFESRKPFLVNVTTGRTSNRMNGLKEFDCEIMVRGGSLSRSVFVRKVGTDFHAVVRRTMETIEKVLRRESKMGGAPHGGERIADHVLASTDEEKSTEAESFEANRATARRMAHLSGLV